MFAGKWAIPRDILDFRFDTFTSAIIYTDRRLLSEAYAIKQMERHQCKCCFLSNQILPL